MFLFFWYHRSHLTLMYTQILHTVKLSGFNYSGLSEMLTHGRVGRLGSSVASSTRAPGGDERPPGHVCGLPEAGSGSLRAPLGPRSVDGSWQRPPSGAAHSVLWGEVHTTSGVTAQQSGPRMEQPAGWGSAGGRVRGGSRGLLQQYEQRHVNLEFTPAGSVWDARLRLRASL